MSRATFVAFGALFGFLLSRARATDYEAIAKMFLLRDLHLFGVIGVAVATAAVGVVLLKRRGLGACLQQKPFHKLVLAGGIVMGIGWGLSGACPGASLAQIGEGKLYAIATVTGILLGTWIQRRTTARAPLGSSAASTAGAC